MTHKASEIILQELHTAIEAQHLARRSLAAVATRTSEVGDPTLAHALETLLMTSGALEGALYALYESEHPGNPLSGPF